MTKQLTAGKPGTITISLVDDNGAAIQASAVSWTLYDADGLELYSGAAEAFVADDLTAVVNLSDVQTTITTPSVAREIILTCTTTDGEVEVREAFLIVSGAPLTVAVNSFQTLTEALLTRSEFATMTGWDGASKNARSAAMIESYRRILRVSLQLHQVPDTYNRIAWYGRRIPLSRISADEFNSLPDGFKRAVKRAQLAEANVLLGGDKIGDKRRQGIVSETIGEASMFLSSKPYLNLPIGREAYEELKSYIRIVVQIGRA